MNIVIKYFFIIILLGISVFSQTTAPERDFQLWNDYQVTVPIKKSNQKKSERVSLLFYGTLRVGRNLSHLVDERIGVGVEFRVNNLLTFTPSYIYRAAQPFEGRKEFENRLRFDFGLEKKFKTFSIKDRNRIEFRFRNSRSDSTRYRNKFQLSIPVKNNNKEIFTPFVADEIFYEFQSKQWSRNEFSAGISKKFNKNTTADFYYTFQNSRGNSFKYVNIIGISFKFKID